MIVTYWSLNKITKYEMHNKAIWQYGRYLDNVKIIINEKDKIQLLRNNNVIAEGVNNIKRILKIEKMQIEKEIIYD